MKVLDIDLLLPSVDNSGAGSIFGRQNSKNMAEKNIQGLFGIPGMNAIRELPYYPGEVIEIASKTCPGLILTTRVPVKDMDAERTFSKAQEKCVGRLTPNGRFIFGRYSKEHNIVVEGLDGYYLVKECTDCNLNQYRSAHEQPRHYMSASIQNELSGERQRLAYNVVAYKLAWSKEKGVESDQLGREVSFTTHFQTVPLPEKVGDVGMTALHSFKMPTEDAPAKIEEGSLLNMKEGMPVNVLTMEGYQAQKLLEGQGGEFVVQGGGRLLTNVLVAGERVEAGVKFVLAQRREMLSERFGGYTPEALAQIAQRKKENGQPQKLPQILLLAIHETGAVGISNCAFPRGMNYIREADLEVAPVSAQLEFNL